MGLLTYLYCSTHRSKANTLKQRNPDNKARLVQIQMNKKGDPLTAHVAIDIDEVINYCISDTCFSTGCVSSTLLLNKKWLKNSL
ncbi:hypothetical protein AhaeAN3_14215 [Acinetobacter haemolyticus]|nr:hypothetical protein BSR56_14430 [Acinetobacter haemolyticus]QHI21039.1 hypothetical protein AhaeAN3_14215 [Acinetobacter haemolyticus]QHI33874.1 hypothetical protein Ahae11616_15215 [Acinetobacter haemolyticus]